MKNYRKHPDGTLYPDVEPFSSKWELASKEEVEAHLKMVAPHILDDGAADKDDAGLGEKDPDSCESLEEAVAMVKTFTANECDAYAGKLGMEPFPARTKVKAKQDAIVAKMQEIAAGPVEDADKAEE